MGPTVRFKTISGIAPLERDPLARAMTPAIRRCCPSGAEIRQEQESPTLLPNAYRDNECRSEGSEVEALPPYREFANCHRLLFDTLLLCGES